MLLFVTMSAFTFHYVSIKSKSLSSLTVYRIEFTFHYVSIKSKGFWQYDACAEEFTFHYVSIKSIGVQKNGHEEEIFTFHYVSIKSRIITWSQSHIKDLHSTMYLLNPDTEKISRLKEMNLHSTMYLLNLYVLHHQM